MRPARCIAPSECWNRLCSAAGNTQRADWSWGTRRNRCTHEVSMRSCSVASPRIAPGRVYRMYWWMGSAMRPRPWYVSAAPFTASRLARPIERVPVDRGHRDDAHEVGALHRHLDQVARAPGPELEVEVLARLDGHAVDADDPVALEHARAGGGPEGRDLADEEPAVGFHRVEPQPGLAGEITKARSSMYSQYAEKRWIAWSWPTTCTRSPSSSMPTVPVRIPATASSDRPSVATGHGPGSSSLITPSPVSRSSPTSRAPTVRPRYPCASIATASRSR